MHLTKERKTQMFQSGVVFFYKFGCRYGSFTGRVAFKRDFSQVALKGPLYLCHAANLKAA